MGNAGGAAPPGNAGDGDDDDDNNVEPVHNITAFLDEDDHDGGGNISPAPDAQYAWLAHQRRLAMTRQYHAAMVARRQQLPSCSFYPRTHGMKGQ